MHERVCDERSIKMKSIFIKLIATALCVLMLTGMFAPSFVSTNAGATLVYGDKPTADLGTGTYVSGDFIYCADLSEDLPQSVDLGFGLGNVDKYLPSNRIVITGYTGNATRLTIPSKIDGYTVGRIAPNAFVPSSTCHTENLTYLKIPSSVYMISGRCFANCKNLSKVVLSEGLEYMLLSPFEGCTKLTEINLPSTIIGLVFAFNGTEISEITVPAAKDAEHDLLELAEGRTYMGLTVFGNSSVRKMTVNKNNVMFIPIASPTQETVFNGTVIPCDAFGLEGVQCGTPQVFFKKGLPDEIANGGAFAGYTRHIDPDGGVRFDHGEPDATNISGDYEYMLNSQSKAVITAYNGTATAVNIPSQLDGHSVVKVGDYSFKNNTSVTSVNLPASVKEIGTYAFYGCTGLSYINLAGVTDIGLGAFKACGSLSSVILAETLEYLGDNAFESTALISVTIPSNITKLGNSLFRNCSALNSISFTGNVDFIGEHCFDSCSSLSSFDFSRAPRYIGDYAFASSGIRSASIGGLRRVGAGVFDNSALESVSVSGVDLELFGTFSYASHLRTAFLGSGVTAVYKETFKNCSQLETLTLGEDVAYISNDTFLGCGNLKTLYYNAKDVSTKFSLSVANIKSEPDFRNQLYRDLSPFKVSFDNIIFGNKVRAIGQGLFSNQMNITSVFLPKSVKTIRRLAFFNCSALETVVWNSPVKKVEVAAFWGCENLVDFNFVNLSTTNLRAFASTNIETVSLGLTAIVEEDTPESQPLPQLNMLRAKSFDSTDVEEDEPYYEEEDEQPNLTVIAEESFENNASLISVGIGGNVETIEGKAFANCENLEKAVISDSVTEIAADAFENCPKLTIYCFENSPAHLYAAANGIRVTTLVIDPIPNQIYTGHAIRPALNVTCSGSHLAKGEDYEVSYSNNINVGTATVRVNGENDYKMLTSTVNFTIVTRDISNVYVLSIDEQSYTGSAVTPEVTVTYSGKILNEGKDYTVNYHNNISSGTAKAVIRGCGNYSGVKTVEFTISDNPQTSPVLRLLKSIIRFFAVFFSLFR